MRSIPAAAPARAFVLALALAPLACSVPKEAGFPDVAAAVKERSGQRIHWNQGTEEDARVARHIKELLAQELTAERAVQIALLNNRGLQATYEGLGVAQADVVQAGMLPNPSVGAALKFPVNGAFPFLDIGGEGDFLSILLIPARTRLAEAEFERAKLEVGNAVLTLAADVRAAFYTLQAGGQALAVQRLIAAGAQASVDLTTRQHTAQNISELDLANERAAYEAVKLDLATMEAEGLAAREQLTRLLGLWGASTQLRVGPKLPELPAAEAPLDHLEKTAMQRRLDIAAARQDVEVTSRALDLAESRRWIPGVSLGAEAEREPGEFWRVGPSAHVEVPLFDQGQATVARLESQRRASEHRLAALAIDVRSEVRSARDRVLFSRSVAEHHQKVVIPLRERIVALSQEHYDAMLIGVYQLLIAKREEAHAYRDAIAALRDYWIARSDLERAIGGKLGSRS